MILVTVGTHNQGFDRLVQAADRLTAETNEAVVIQAGASGYTPRHARWFRYTSPLHLRRLMQTAHLIITHAGAGSLLEAVESGVPVIAVPRLAARNEHVDDHQIELARALSKEGLVVVLTDLRLLPEATRTPFETPRAPILVQRDRLNTQLARELASWESRAKVGR